MKSAGRPNGVEEPLHLRVEHVVAERVAIGRDSIGSGAATEAANRASPGSRAGQERRLRPSAATIARWPMPSRPISSGSSGSTPAKTTSRPSSGNLELAGRCRRGQRGAQFVEPQLRQEGHRDAVELRPSISVGQVRAAAEPARADGKAPGRARADPHGRRGAGSHLGTQAGLLSRTRHPCLGGGEDAVALLGLDRARAPWPGRRLDHREVKAPGDVDADARLLGNSLQSGALTGCDVHHKVLALADEEQPLQIEPHRRVLGEPDVDDTDADRLAGHQRPRLVPFSNATDRPVASSLAGQRQEVPGGVHSATSVAARAS